MKSIIELKNVAKTFFSQKLYKNVNLVINKGDKIAVVGNNGVGKSTFIRLIAGEEFPDKGQIIIDEEATISIFDQFGKINNELEMKELLDIPFEKVIAAQKELEELSAKFTDNSSPELMEKYSELSDKFESLGGYSYIHLQNEFAEVFGLTDKLERKFKELSGGEKQYIRLAMTLFSPTDLIILDEPLSFFDKKKTAWLTNFITESTKAFLIISHNVDFIRAFANKIFDIDNYEITTYETDYANYLKEKKVFIAEKKLLKKEADEIIKSIDDAVTRKYNLIAKSENKQGQAIILRRMQKELYQLDQDKIEFSPEYKYKYVAIPEEVYISEREVEGDLVTLADVSKNYGDRVLYKNVNLTITKNTKMCLVGENGSGKSTLLRIIAGQEEPTTGTVTINPKARICYVEQETVFDDEKIYVTEYLQKMTGLHDDFIEVAIHTLFNSEDEFKDKRIFMLSGGEKKRLEIFANILSDTDLLIIDEPSTYMDDYSRRQIIKMLSGYEGAVIIVTHDKTLLKQLSFDTYDIRDKMFRPKEKDNK